MNIIKSFIHLFTHLSVESYVVIGVILLVFLLSFFQLLRLYNASKHILSASKGVLLDSAKGKKLEQLCKDYKKTITINTHEGLKSNIPSAYYFNDLHVSRAYKFNLKMLESTSGSLVGLGLFGTFLGLTLGISGFDSSNSDNIQQSIQHLLDGMGTAFVTSLVGMLLSLIYTFFEKKNLKGLQRNLLTLTESLDDAYYIDDIALQRFNQETLLRSLRTDLKNDMEQKIHTVVLTLEDKLTYLSDAGDNVPIGNAVREILRENTEQSRALKSFSTDLAIQLNDSFDEVLSRQMQQKILPLMENVDATTKAIVEHIDQMAAQVSSPASDMIQNVVTELKNSMKVIMEDFKSSLSKDATHELENLALQLGTASQAMTDFPRNMENISTTLQNTIEEVKATISEISNTSADANTTALRQMQIQSDQMVSKLSDATGKMGEFLNSTISGLSASFQQSIQGIAENINDRQTDLIALQEDTTIQTKKLLDSFNQGLDRLVKINEYLDGAMNMFHQAQGQISGSTAHLQTITGDMKDATQILNRNQNEYLSKMQEIQQNSQRGIDSVAELIKDSGVMSKDYVAKFEIIKQGLSAIFSQLQNGLNEYSRTVMDSTQKYLDQYSTSLTQTTDALASTIQQQNEVTEMLTETISKIRR